MESIKAVRSRLSEGLAIPACPLALNAQRRFDERRQRALFRYYLAAGAGGIAVGVHTTQFAIRDPKIGLFRPVLELAAEEMRRADGALENKSGVTTPDTGVRARVKIAGVCGQTTQAVREAALARELGFHAALLSLGVLKGAGEDEALAHCRAVADIVPIFGFYLQPAAGGRQLPYSFWRRFAEIENVVAIKIAPFNRYQSLDVIRAVAESGRDDIALYTGNDDSIVVDLLMPFRFNVNGEKLERRIVGGLLGHWAVWTRAAVEIFERVQALQTGAIPVEWLTLAAEITDANAALFDVANQFHGCIAGIHEVLRRQGLLAGTWCLNPNESLSPGQAQELDRVCAQYPHLTDNEFVRANLDTWLKP